VRGWILALPEPVRAAQPRLSYLLGMCEWHRGALPAAVRLLEAARPGLAAAGDTGAEGRCLAYLALHAALQYRFAAALEYLDSALARPLPPVLRAHLLIEQAHALLISQQRAAAAVALNAALDLGEASDDPAVLAALLRYYHPPFGVLPGAFARLVTLCARAERTPLDPASPAGVSLARHWITVHLLQGDIAAAIRRGEETLAHTQAGGPNFQVQMIVSTTLAQAYYIGGQPERAATLLEELATGLAELAAHPAVYTVLLYLWGRACWAAGRLDAARTLHARLRARLIPVLEMQAADEILGGLLAWAAGDLAGAERRLRAMAEVEDDLLALALNTSPRLLLAALYVEMACPREALDTLEQVLARYSLAGGPGYLMREGTVIVPLLRLAVAEGRHADLARDVLRLLGAADPTPPATGRSTGPAGSGDPVLISPREREVLRLLATGASNRAIAAQLVIGEQTVKTHLIHLFRKLEVTTRTGAVQRARDLGLI
jgi:ATP/maltotriose-dependent transcriptional regulator MalT